MDTCQLYICEPHNERGPGTMAGEEEGKGVGKRGGKEMDGKGKGM